MAEFADYQAFDPHGYLSSYYATVGNEAEGLLRFLADQFRDLEDGLRVLEFGGGPTLIGVIPAARRASHIHFCDLLAANREAVSRWLAGDETEFDWRPFVQRCLELEGASDTVQSRIEQMRSTVDKVTYCDIYQTPPVEAEEPFDVVMANYCLDAVTSDIDEWQAHVLNLRQLVKPGGRLLLSSLEQAGFSQFDDTRFPNVRLTGDEVYRTLKALGFPTSGIEVVTAPADHPDREYTGVIFTAARV